MKRSLLPGLLVGILIPVFALAQEPKPPLPAAPIPLAESPPITVPAPEGCAAPGRTICLDKVHLVEDQCATTIPKLTLREEVIGTKQIQELYFHEEKQTVTALVQKPREVEQQVECTTMQPCTTVDPCTGCPHTVYNPVPIMRTVKVTVYDIVPETREVIVRVPCLRPGPELQLKRLTLDSTQEPAIRTTLRAIPEHNEVHVPECPAPVCLPK
jgi:hypothetical protein